MLMLSPAGKPDLLSAQCRGDLAGGNQLGNFGEVAAKDTIFRNRG